MISRLDLQTKEYLKKSRTNMWDRQRELLFLLPPLKTSKDIKLNLLLYNQSCKKYFYCCPSCVDVHTEAVQAALAKYKERKMPMPSKRRSVLVHSSVETYTPPGIDKQCQEWLL